MNIIRTEALCESQKNDLLTLQNICQGHDSISLTFPMEEGWVYYLLYDEDRLLSALSAFFNENSEWECCAFTLPQHRRQGCFTMLFEELLKETGENDLIFSVQESCRDTVSTLEAIGATFWYQEHMMSLSASDFSGSALVKGCDAPESISIVKKQSFPDEPVHYVFLAGEKAVGSCYLDSRENSSYFYGFEIPENLRNQGYGRACLSLFLNTYFPQAEAENEEALFLQVSGKNAPAIALYKKAGFQITESLSYYIY
ncbi:MAG: GNAT family N-acetyltransferase [Lacrimispora sp.]|uniref:GNAT family N-acetyltransferase n=1 Tax=Lacrimispora sp. TaxID=2719234 RepID=UPI0039E31E53